jgi:hypothetical protein
MAKLIQEEKIFNGLIDFRNGVLLTREVSQEFAPILKHGSSERSLKDLPIPTIKSISEALNNVVRIEAVRVFIQSHPINPPTYQGDCLKIGRIIDCIRKESAQEQDLAIVRLLQLSNGPQHTQKWAEALIRLFHIPELFKKVVRWTMLHFFDESITEEHKKTLDHLEEPCLKYMSSVVEDEESLNCLNTNLSNDNIDRASEMLIRKMSSFGQEQVMNYLKNPKIFGLRGNTRESSFKPSLNGKKCLLID